MFLDDFEIMFLLGVFLILLVILYMCSFIIRSCLDDYPGVGIYLNSNECNTGDIVFCSYYTPAGVLISTISNSIWSHPGFIWVDEDTGIRYVLEGAIYKQTKYRNFYKIPLENWLFINKRSMLGYKKYTGKPIDSKYMLSKFQWMIDECRLGSFDPLWARFIINKQHYEYSRNEKYTCSEAAVILGQETGIFERDKIYCSYLPGDLANGYIKLTKDASYDNVVEILQHPTERLSILEDSFFNKTFWKK